MTRRPTYEELEQRVKELEKEAGKREEAEAELRKYQFVIESAHDAIFFKDLGSRYIIANDKTLEAFGLSREDVIGKNDFELMPDQKEAEKNVYDDQIVFRSGKHTEVFKHMTGADGKEHWFQAIKVPQFDNDGKVTGLVGIARDITDRKRVEEVLQKSEARFRAIFEKTAVGILIVDSKTRKYIRVNPAFQNMLGYNTEEFSSMGPHDIVYPEDWLSEENLLEELLSRKRDQYQIEKRYVRKDGGTVWCRATVSMVYDGSGRPEYTVSIVEDISGRKQAEESQRRLETQLRQAHKMESIGTLAGGIAHDFNNILAIILANAELALEDVPEWNPAKFNLNEIRTASLRAKDVVRQLLSFARKTRLEKKPINIVPIVKESLKLLRSSIPTSIEIRKNIKKDVDIILADPTQINQVLINLCTNADHAMPDGGIIEVTLKNAELDKDIAAQYPELHPGRYVNLIVSDTGYGIPHEDYDRIFDPYFTTKEVGKGTGMGLAVVHGIVQGHNGFIAVESKPGKGTTFNIFFPVVEIDAVVETETVEELPTGGERILFVDDEESIVKLGYHRLERLGYSVEATTSPIEALELFRSQADQFDLVITDLTMPQMTGDKLAKELINIRSDIPIILCTGFYEKMSKEKADAFGIKDLLMKPIIKSDLAKTVREVLKER